MHLNYLERAKGDEKVTYFWNIYLSTSGLEFKMSSIIQDNSIKNDDAIYTLAYFVIFRFLGTDNWFIEMLGLRCNDAVKSAEYVNFINVASI